MDVREKLSSEKRLIDASAMRDDWLENCENEYVYDTNAVLDSIDSQPTVDAVEVVRCRECKYSFYDEIFGNFWCNSHSGCRKVKDEGFCDLGERKEGAD